MKYLTLVNKSFLIKDSYFKYVDLVDYKDYEGKTIKVEKKTLEAYLDLKEFLETINIKVAINSCFKTFEEQQIKTSEYHTGLAIDLKIILPDNLTEEVYLEVHKHLKDFGFILRYPKGKKDITGYDYEASHIRYVGVVPAKIMYENNWTLEEYLKKLSGILVVNKDKDMTSFDVVNEVSHIFGIKKVGHTGTLDPLATGVLVLTLGKYTKLGEDLVSLDKEYIAEVEQGILTDTLDTTGKILEKNNNRIKDVSKKLKEYEKEYLQEVPIYSAVKVEGKKLYEYARENKEVDLPKKKVIIKNIELINENKDNFTFKTTVSKGTYIRSLIRDIGLSNNTLLTMSNLQRTRQGKFKLEDSFTLEDIRNGNYKLLSVTDILDYPIIDIDEELFKQIDNGVIIDNKYNIKDKVIFRYKNDIIAIYVVYENKLKMYKKIS